MHDNSTATANPNPVDVNALSAKIIAIAKSLLIAQGHGLVPESYLQMSLYQFRAVNKAIESENLDVQKQMLGLFLNGLHTPDKNTSAWVQNIACIDENAYGSATAWALLCHLSDWKEKYGLPVEGMGLNVGKSFVIFPDLVFIIVSLKRLYMPYFNSLDPAIRTPYFNCMTTLLGTDLGRYFPDDPMLQALSFGLNTVRQAEKKAKALNPSATQVAWVEVQTETDVVMMDQRLVQIDALEENSSQTDALQENTTQTDPITPEPKHKPKVGITRTTPAKQTKLAIQNLHPVHILPTQPELSMTSASTVSIEPTTAEDMIAPFTSQPVVAKVTPIIPTIGTETTSTATIMSVTQHSDTNTIITPPPPLPRVSESGIDGKSNKQIQSAKKQSAQGNASSAKKTAETGPTLFSTLRTVGNSAANFVLTSLTMLKKSPAKKTMPSSSVPNERRGLQIRLATGTASEQERANAERKKQARTQKVELKGRQYYINAYFNAVELVVPETLLAGALSLPWGMFFGAGGMAVGKAIEKLLDLFVDNPLPVGALGSGIGFVLFLLAFSCSFIVHERGCVLKRAQDKAAMREVTTPRKFFMSLNWGWVAGLTGSTATLGLSHVASINPAQGLMSVEMLALVVGAVALSLTVPLTFKTYHDADKVLREEKASLRKQGSQPTPELKSLFQLMESVVKEILDPNAKRQTPPPRDAGTETALIEKAHQDIAKNAEFQTLLQAAGVALTVTPASTYGLQAAFNEPDETLVMATNLFVFAGVLSAFYSMRKSQNIENEYVRHKKILAKENIELPKPPL